MALSRRIDLTEQGDFQSGGRGSFIRWTSRNTPLHDRIEHLYSRRKDRIRAEWLSVRDNNDNQNNLNVTLANPNETGNIFLPEIEMNEVIRRLDGLEKGIFPWTFKKSWEDAARSYQDELVLTGNKKDITKKKRWQSLDEKNECACCGYIEEHLPWGIHYGLCATCEIYYLDRDHEEDSITRTRSPFTESIQELEHRRRNRIYENSIRFGNNILRTPR